MTDRACGARFAEKPLAPRRPILVLEEFQRTGFSRDRVRGGPDDPHSTFAERTVQSVLAGDDRPAFELHHVLHAEYVMMRAMVPASFRPRLRAVETIVVPDRKHGKVLVLRDTQGIAQG